MLGNFTLPEASFVVVKTPSVVPSGMAGLMVLSTVLGSKAAESLL